MAYPGKECLIYHKREKEGEARYFLKSRKQDTGVRRGELKCPEKPSPSG
jgi:hypothetical protein